MTKVLYAYCTKPDFPLRIRAFERELGWEPVGIVTSAANQEELAAAYPSVPVHNTLEFSGRVLPFSKGVVSAASLLDDLEYFQPYVSSAFSMMDRFGLPEQFALWDRKRYLRQLLHEWGAYLDVATPDLAHFDESPHGVSYFVVYHLCKRREIPVVWFRPTGFIGFNLLGDTVGAPPLGMLFDPTTPAVVRTSIESIEVSQRMLQRVESFRADGDFKHWYMDLQESTATASRAPSGGPQAVSAIAGALRKIRKIGNVAKWPLYARAIPRLVRHFFAQGPAGRAAKKLTALAGRPLWLRQPVTNGYLIFSPAQNHRPTNGDFVNSLNVRARHKERLRDSYGARSCAPYFGRNYVYFALHFQPERTTNPEGGILDDQIAVIASLHDALPADWVLYVKEHPTQFHPNYVYASEKGRFEHDYEELAALKNVRLIDIDVPSSELVRHARAVVTITGTVAFEAAANGVPGIHMAHTWYEGFPGTVYLPSHEGIAAFLADIGSYEPTSQAKEMEYLRKFLASAFEYEVSEQDLPAGTFSPEQQERGAVDAMRWWQDTYLESNKSQLTGIPASTSATT